MSGNYNLDPAGYLIVRPCEDVPRVNDYRRSFGAYYGVDRLPALFPADPAIRSAIGEPRLDDPRLAAAIDELENSHFGNTAFLPRRTHAFQLLNTFGTFGLRFELLYCQLAWREGEEQRRKSYPRMAEASVTYGFDVSWPSCNHSAILQPGVVPSSISWRAKLNQYGLLDHYDVAVTLRDEYLGVYPYPPFDVYLVHSVAHE